MSWYKSDNALDRWLEYILPSLHRTEQGRDKQKRPSLKMYVDDGELSDEEDANFLSFDLLAAQLNISLIDTRRLLKEGWLNVFFKKIYREPVLKVHGAIQPVNMYEVVSILEDLFRHQEKSLESLVAQNPHHSVIRATEFVIAVGYRLTDCYNRFPGLSSPGSMTTLEFAHTFTLMLNILSFLYTDRKVKLFGKLN